MTSRKRQGHGTRGCYQRGCRLPECQRANYRYSKQLGVDHAQGTFREQDATRAREHMEKLLALQWRQADISRATGISRSVISLLANGQQATSAVNVAAILAIPIGHLVRPGDRARVPAVGSMRRLRALATLGHTWKVIALQTDITDDRLGDMARGVLNEVRPEEAQSIARVYRRLCNVKGRCAQVASCAVGKGWHGPLAWDDIDDPTAKPEACEPYRPIPKNGRDSMRRQEVQHLLACGESVASIAKRMRANEKYIGDLAREGLDDSQYDTAA
ncbi:hypothetical protein ACWENA_08435 [Streptomyces sp. NPDC004779]